MKMTGIFPNCILLLIIVLTLSSRAGAAELGEYDIKSGMLYNFTLFIEWPDGSLDKTRGMEVCIAGESPSNRSFQRLQGKTYKDRRIVVRQIREPGGTAGCNLLFINRSEHRQLSAYLQAAQKRAVLTVSDIDGFASKGGMVGFFEQDGKVRFEINLDAARQARFKINSQLLKLARIVTAR